MFFFFFFDFLFCFFFFFFVAFLIFCFVFFSFFLFFFKEKENKAKNARKKGKMKRNASKRDDRHGRSRHRQTKVFEIVKLILRPSRSQQFRGGHFYVVSPRERFCVVFVRIVVVVRLNPFCWTGPFFSTVRCTDESLTMNG